MKHILLIFLTISFFVISTNVYSQGRVKKWVKKEVKENYVEGVYSLEVSTAVELVSFTGAFSGYEKDKAQQLHFHYYAPESTPFLLTVGERSILNYYRLESNPGMLQMGQRQFGPVNVDAPLGKYVPASNFAALLRIKEDNSKYILPLLISNTLSAPKLEKYQAVLRLGQSIAGARIKIYKGEHSGLLPADKLVATKKAGRKLGGSVMSMNIDPEKLNGYSGWVTVDVTMKLLGQTTKTPYRFYFYHKDSQ